MKKSILRITVTTIILSLILPMLLVFAKPNVPTQTELRGVWVATVLNIDYPSKAAADPEILKKEAVAILDNVKDMGMNAVFLQVRPASDALYKSNIFPWSKYLTGTQGLSPANDFDPLAFWVTEAHNRGIELHAWVNPYRVTKMTSKDKRHDFNSLADNNPAKLHPEWVVKYYDGNLYYDPGIPEVRQLVIDGVMEIVQNYDVDGIHFDDYFYPGKDFIDKTSFEKYGAGYASKDDWRRANVDTLIGDLNTAIKATGKNVRFGISPIGIWANKATNKLGSDTKGKQAYYDQYADTRKWVKKGMVDYIAPQIYWNIGYAIADYSKLITWWQDVARGTGVDLYIGQAAYRTGTGKSTDPWYGITEIDKQLKLNAKNPDIKGSIFFSYRTFINNKALAPMVKAYYLQKDGAATNIPVNMARPAGNLKTSLSSFYLTGSSDPTKPLLLNGKPVENRSSKGYFGVLVPLTKGQNIITLSQEGSYMTRVIYREVASAATTAKMSAADIPASSVFPKTQEYRSPGEKVTFTCQAPIGSVVTVKLGSETYLMKPAVASTKATGLIPTKYSYTYTVPSYEGNPTVIDVGAPEYTMNYKGTIKTRKAPAGFGIIMKNAPFYGEVTKPVIYTYNNTNTSEGAAFELYRGMIDNITAMTGGFLRLSTGQWVLKGDLKTSIVQTPVISTITKAEYITGEKWDALKLELTSPTAAIADFNGTVMKFSVSKSNSGILPVLPENSPFAKVEATEIDNKVQYTLTIKDGQYIEGYFVEKTDTGLVLNLKRPVKANTSDTPMTGITIMIDAGHGGSDPGAIGPLGSKYSEEHMNLDNALKLQTELQKLGATVLMTRTTDKALSLDERLTASRNAKPDLFVSVHANSMGDNVDISKIDGFSLFYRETLSKPVAETVFNNTIQGLGRKNKGFKSKNFYVIRGTWTPAILLEMGFVPNPQEFEWLTDQNEQTKAAQNIAQGILMYFTSSK